MIKKFSRYILMGLLMVITMVVPGCKQEKADFVVNFNNEIGGEDLNQTYIEVGEKGVFSESLTIQLLDTLKAAGDIDTDEYIELYPESIMVFKEKLKKMREKKLMEQQMLIEQEQMLNEMAQMEAQGIPNPLNQTPVNM